MYHVTWAHCCARFTIHIPLTKKNSSSSSLFSSISQADAEAARTSVCLVSVPSLFQCLYISSPDLISRCQSTFSSFVLFTRKTLFSILQQSSHISACTHSYHFFICHHRYHAAHLSVIQSLPVKISLAFPYSYQVIFSLLVFLMMNLKLLHFYQL